MKNSALKKLIEGGLIFPLLVLALWWYGAARGWWNSFLLPAPYDVLRAFNDAMADGTLPHNLWASVSRIAVGFGLSAVLALALAFFTSAFPFIGRQLEPTLEFLRHIPPMAVIPMLILWFGIGETPKIILIILATFFPVFLNTLQGIKDCDPKLKEVARVFGYTKWETCRRVILPSALPSIFTGLRLGLGYSWRSLVAAELVAASSGLGYMILDAEQLSRSDVVLMGIFVIGALGAALDCIFALASKFAFKRAAEK
ncbi:MAG: ABC transporter permease [Cloacibacillus sp.]